MTQPELKSDPDVIALAPTLTRVSSFAKSLTIRTADDYKEAGGILKMIKAAIIQIETTRTKISKPINEGLRVLMAESKASQAPFLDAEYAVKAALAKYDDEQEALRIAEQRRANEAAAKEQKRLQAIADAAAAKGQTAKAERFEERAVSVVAPVAQHAAPKVEGLTISMVWDFEITDAKLIPCTYHDINETRIRKVVLAMGANCNIPGVRVFQKKRISSTSS